MFLIPSKTKLVLFLTHFILATYFDKARPPSATLANKSNPIIFDLTNPLVNLCVTECIPNLEL